MLAKSIYLLIPLGIVLCLQSLSIYADSFDLAIGHSLQKIRQDGADINTLCYSKSFAISLARDESESFQIVVIPKAMDLHNIKITIERTALPESIKVRWYKVGYVRTGNPSYPVRYVGLWPDPLFTMNTFDVSKAKVQPLWFTVTSSADTPAGVYRFAIIVSGSDDKTAIKDKTIKRVDIFVRIRNFTLPRPGSFAAPFGLYMKKIAEWYYGKGKTLDIKDFAYWCEFISKNYRLTPKNIGYEYVKREYKELSDGRKILESVDMNALQETVGSLAKYFPDYSFGFYRLPSGSTVKQVLSRENADKYIESLIQPIKIYYDEWKKQGFPSKVYIYGIDEPPDADKSVFQFLHKLYGQIKTIIPEAKIMQTGNCDNPHLADLVDIWCPKTERMFLPFFINQRSKGDILWSYVCVSPIRPYANFFIDEPAIDHRILFWQCKKAGANGFLYWSTTWWDGFTPACAGKKCFPDVQLDIRNHCQFRNSWVHVNGDGFLLYPGKDLKPIPSIRIEIIRDGIEDAEYINLLSSLIDKVKGISVYKKKGNRNLIKSAERLLHIPQNIVASATVYTHQPNDIFEYRNKVANMIEQLIDVLNNQDYKLWK